jgi:hypothetical protein
MLEGKGEKPPWRCDVCMRIAVCDGNNEIYHEDDWTEICEIPHPGDIAF